MTRLLWTALLTLALAAIGTLAAPGPALAQDAGGGSAPAGIVRTGNTAPFCRFGVTLWEKVNVNDFDLGGLRSSWYVDYYSPAAAHPAGLDFAPILRLAQVGEDGYRVGKSYAQIDALLAANPGSLVMIGNEPDRRIYQDDIEPAVYAVAYHDLYAYIKARDPSAQVLAGNIVQPTPVRLQYLDLVLAAYRSRYGEEMPVDAWSIHAFILNERSCRVHPNDCWGADIPPGVDAAEGLVIDVDETDRFDLFVAGIERFRRWMAERGYRDRPLYVTELGVLMPPDYGYPAARVNRFLRRAFDYLLAAQDRTVGYPPDGNRLVQRFAWYAVIEPQFNGGLFAGQNPDVPDQPPYTITEIGRAYRDYTAGIAPSVQIDIAAAPVAPPLSQLPQPGGPFTATLAVRLGNSGNLQEAAAVTVAVYDGVPVPGQPPLTPPQTVALQGCGDTAALTFQWRSPAEGAANDVLAVVVDRPGGRTVQLVGYFAPGAWLYAPVVVAAGS